MDQNLGLTPYLQPVDSPIVQNQGAVTAYDFFGDYERNAISNGKIQSLNFSKGQGGTLTLGGAGNGNGYFVIKDASGGTIVTGNNQGLTIYNGSLTIQNSSGSTVLDSSGVVSNTNFKFDSVSDYLDTRTTNSTSFVDVPSGSITTASLTGTATRVLFLAYGDFSNYGGANDILSEYVALNVDGTLYPDSSNGFGNTWFWAGGTATSLLETVTGTWSGHTVVSLGTGTHVAKLQYRRSNTSTISARVINTTLTYLVLGN